MRKYDEGNLDLDLVDPRTTHNAHMLLHILLAWDGYAETADSKQQAS